MSTITLDTIVKLTFWQRLGALFGRRIKVTTMAEVVHPASAELLLGQILTRHSVGDFATDAERRAGLPPPESPSPLPTH